MNNHNMNIPLFGRLSVSEKDGLCEDFNIVLCGEEMAVTLIVFENLISEETIGIVRGFLEHIPEMYQKGKDILLKTRETDETVRFFVSFYLDDPTEELLEILGEDSFDSVTSETLIRRLTLRTVSIAPDCANQIDCTMDFSLPEEFTDQLLAVRFNAQYEIYDISHES